MNHAFIILAHTQPALLNRILSRLKASNHFFFINIDKKACYDEFSPILRDNNVSYISNLCVYHGGFSMITVTLHLLEAVAKSKVKIDYVHLISGQDYPVVSNEEFDDRFERADGYSFMWYDRDDEHARWIVPGGIYEKRYRWWCFSREDIKISFLRWFVAKFDSCSHRFLIRKRIEGIRAGWQWFSWHISVVCFVLNYLNDNQEYLRRFRHTCCTDELIFHTLLYPHLERLKIHKSDALRYIDWYPKRQYTGKLPLVLEEVDYDDIINSKALLCRKVDSKKSSKLLDMLDRAAIIF